MSASLSQQLSARRSPQAKKQAQRLWWTGALASLWAPLTLTAIGMVPYLFVVELNPAAASWAFPLMQGFGLLMVAAFALLVLLRALWPAFRLRRAAEQETDELLAEVATALKRAPTLAPEKREKLVAQAASLDARRLAAEVPGMRAEAKSLAELAERTLPSFRKSPTVDLVVGLFKALLVALLIRAVFIEPYRIPSGSMIPTLQIGDQIFINKLIYGVRLPFVNFVPFVIVRPPERGDVIVFNNPVDTSEDFVKRVAGVPGDSVELRDRVVYVNGVEQKRTLAEPQHAFWDYRMDSGQWLLRHGQLWREDLNGRVHSVIQMPGGGIVGSPNEGPYLVPPGHVFVMGDDRDLSSDSRYGLGGPEIKTVFVPYGNIKGKAMIIWLSLSHGGLLSGLTGGAGLQANRFFLPVR